MTRFEGINTDNPTCKVEQRWKHLVSTFAPISVTSGFKLHASPAEMAGLRTSRSVRLKNSRPPFQVFSGSRVSSERTGPSTLLSSEEPAATLLQRSWRRSRMRHSKEGATFWALQGGIGVSLECVFCSPEGPELRVLLLSTLGLALPCSQKPCNARCSSRCCGFQDWAGNSPSLLGPMPALVLLNEQL